MRRIFRGFASDVSPRAISRRLNARNVPCRPGKLWTDSTIRGQVKRGTGLINNQLYIGRLVWNRPRYVTTPETGKQVPWIGPREEWIVTEASGTPDHRRWALAGGKGPPGRTDHKIRNGHRGDAE